MNSILQAIKQATAAPTKTEILKPCPFCGASAQFDVEEDIYRRDYALVSCTNCGCQTVTAKGNEDSDKEYVANLWNCREQQTWILPTEQLPEVNAEGESKYVQLCVYWASSGAAGVFPAVYLEGKELQDTYSCEYKKWTGWHTYSYRKGGDFEEVYDPITLKEGDYIVGWQPFAPSPKQPVEVQP